MEDIGFSAYLVKPTRQSDLFDSLSTVLARPDQSRPRAHIVTRHALREMRRGAVRILLAEDNLTNQQVALGILRKLGLHADVVNDGSEALKTLETSRYDLVLMDVQMPGVDGLEATRRIRDPGSRVLNHEVPIIAMTAHAMQGDRDRCIEAGMDDYVTKPISPQSLADAVDRWLPREEAVPAAQAAETRTAARTTEASTATPIFDRASLLARLMDDDELASAVVSGFLEDAPKLITTLGTCLRAGDAQGVHHQAHTIKGAAATVGGEAVRAVAADIERAAADGDLQVAGLRFPDLEAEFVRLREAMTVSSGMDS
jgi:CheY-like chemotaxis protein/HPt (histidine-containing phosphotransfer) domain-containing protein